jgi:hypothetical protein
MSSSRQVTNRWLAALALAAGAATPVCAQGPAKLPDLAKVKPYVLAREGGHHVLADLSPAWAELSALTTADARKEYLALCALLLVKRDGVVKFPQAQAFEVRLVRVVEYDNYNRPMLATAKELLKVSVPVAKLPAEASPEALARAARALDGATFSAANFP